MTLQEIKTLLEKDAGWMDADGNTLLHHAARHGDAALVKECLQKGVKIRIYNEAHESARDVARSWGWLEAAHQIDAAMRLERATTPCPAIPYASLKEIRDKGTHIFHELALRGMFDSVIALALKTQESFMAGDLLCKGADGESVILKICQQGQVADLLKKDLWAKSPSDLLLILEAVPKIYLKGLNVESFVSDVRQSKIQARPRWKGPS